MLEATRASGLVPVWEKRLAKHGLAMCQIVSQETQTLPGGHGCHFQVYSFDDELHCHWSRLTPAELTPNEIYRGFNLVPCRHLPRQADAPWAYNDLTVRAVLLAMYPRLGVKHSPSRRYASRAAYMLYAKYRLGRTEVAIAEDLHVTVQNIEKILQKLRRKADTLFLTQGVAPHHQRQQAKQNENHGGKTA
jgi:hypothetical protein